MSRTKKAVEYEEVYRYLKHSSYESECLENRKRVIRRFSANIVLESDGHLWKTKPGPKKKWIHEKQAQQQILESVHVSGDRHCDRVKTKENLDSEPVFWPSIQKDIIDYIKRCEECQKATPKLMKQAKRECISASATAPPGTEMAGNKHTSTAPPLTVDNVLKVVKGVNWRSFGERLCPIFILLVKVVEGCVSDEAHLEAVVKDYLDNKPKPSWRDVIWSLYEANQIHLADPQIRSYAEPLEDSTLTVENLLRVMKKVTSEDEEKRKKVWESVFEWEGCIPYSYLDEVESKYTTAREKTNVLADVYVSSYPEPSWEQLVENLYYCCEMAAAKEAKSFLQNNDSTLTVDNLLRVMKKVTSEDEEKRREVWGEVLEKWDDQDTKSYLDEVESKYTTAREKTNVLADVYVNSHPEPSWKHIVEELYYCCEMAAAKEAKSFLQKNELSLSVNNLLRVIQKVTSDKETRRKVWEKVLQCQYEGGWLMKEYTPDSYLDAIDIQYTAEKEKTYVLADVYINSHPDSSWEHLVKTLKQNGEQAAAKEAESFLHQSDYIKVASDQPGGSSEDPSIPPPAKYKKISVSLSNGGASNESGAQFAPTIDCELTIRNLKLLRSAAGGGEKINIIERLAPKWTDLGDLLDFDKSSSKLDEIEEKYPDNPEACCRAMFKHWIEGNGVQPSNWSNLIELLRECHQNDLANEIKAALTV